MTELIDGCSLEDLIFGAECPIKVTDFGQKLRIALQVSPCCHRRWEVPGGRSPQWGNGVFQIRGGASRIKGAGTIATVGVSAPLILVVPEATITIDESVSIGQGAFGTVYRLQFTVYSLQFTH